MLLMQPLNAHGTSFLIRCARIRQGGSQLCSQTALLQSTGRHANSFSCWVSPAHMVGNITHEEASTSLSSLAQAWNPIRSQGAEQGSLLGARTCLFELMRCDAIARIFLRILTLEPMGLLHDTKQSLTHGRRLWLCSCYRQGASSSTIDACDTCRLEPCGKRQAALLPTCLTSS
ncbi:hypothetical protein BDW74DRAFT_143817 [Aspergillus multicolor]|uniref:uncharacterized protein n=1 Tax=Aspergillus multicolor TaxID=41759 RepID=UPI003CCCC6D3